MGATCHLLKDTSPGFALTFCWLAMVMPWATLELPGETTVFECDRMNICVPPQIPMLKPDPSGMVFEGGDFGRWLGHEGRALMNGNSVLVKGTPKSSLTPFAMLGHREKMASCELGNRPSPDSESASALTLGFPTSRTMRNKGVNTPSSL